MLTNYLRATAYKDLLNPVIAAFGLRFDAYVGGREFESDGGLRAMIQSPILRLSGGVDYNIPDRELDFALTLTHPLQRGGVLVRGGNLEVDWIPGRGNSFNFGIVLPIQQPFAGRTRPDQDRISIDRPKPDPVRLADPEASQLEAAAAMRESADKVVWLTLPYLDQNAWGREKADHRFAEEVQRIGGYLATDQASGPDRPTVNEEVARYHRALDETFAITAGAGPTSRNRSRSTAAEMARETFLEQVILPYNRLLGQKKEHDDLDEFLVRARGVYLAWLHRDSPVASDRRSAVYWAFDQYLEAADHALAESLKRWDDLRFGWIPYQLALRPEDHDTQAEIDRLVERAVEEDFTDGNRIWWVVNEQFHRELGRMILEAEDYHVLWVHDIRGMNGDRPDAAAYGMALTWLRAMINRVNAYDKAGTFPTYTVILDQWFYEVNGGHFWLDLVEDPLEHKMSLPDDYAAWGDSVAAVQEELRQAVASSALLQAQAGQFGEDWLKNLIKVHVNITNPSDPTFWSGETIPFVGLPDNIMRDHRKISFFDLTEEDPYKGRGMYTGMGVGEHYLGASWEDRAIMVQGPAALGLKTAAHDLLKVQGFTDQEMPHVFRPRPFGPRYALQVADEVRTGRNGRALDVHNQVGYGPKYANLIKATLYSLMPPGSVIKSPDSLWNSPFWASLLLAHALRGGRSMIIAPSLEHAPSAGFPQMSRAQEVLARSLVARDLLAENLAAVGGEFRLGIYNPSVGVSDVVGKLDALVDLFENESWVREFYPFNDTVIDQWKEVAQELRSSGFQVRYIEEQADTTPRLHMKAGYFSTPEAWGGILALPEWAGVFEVYLDHLAMEAQAGDDQYIDYNQMMVALLRPAAPLAAAFSRLPTRDQERMATYALYGSHNQNLRSMAMDGEVVFAMAGNDAILTVLDFVMLMGVSTWVTTPEELEPLLPEYGNLWRRIARWIKWAA